MNANDLKYALSADLKDYKSIPFWSWNNTLDKNELVKQIDEMKKVGIGGFIMHARIGLKTEYLGEEWFECIDACLKEAKRLDMNAWIYDENGWPSGFVGGKLLERQDYRAQYLEYEIKDYYDDNAFAVFAEDGDFFVRLNKDEKTDKYFNVYLRTSPSNTDILNPEVTDEFIRQTHEEYYKRFSESFGNELVGFFTDEPQYYRYATPYTQVAETEYFRQYGEDIKDGLMYLLAEKKEGKQFRIRYYSLLNKLYCKNFYKKLYDWCERHKCKLTGHSVEETSLGLQMLGGAGVMPSYEYEHIPAIDCLGRHCMSELSPKQVSSVAAQLGKKQILTESFACSGYDVTPKELKSIAEAQYFNGVNLLCHHLLPYSISAQGKSDHPPVFSKHNNWWEQFKIFNDYFTKLGYIIANTEEIVDVAVLHPMSSVYIDYIRSEEFKSVAQLDDDFSALIAALRYNGILYHFIDDSILSTYGVVDKGTIIVGKCKYHKLIVPKMKNISSNAFRIIKNAQNKGLKVLSLGEISYVDGEKYNVDLNSNTNFEEIINKSYLKVAKGDKNIFVTARKSGLGEFLFIKNNSLTQSGKIELVGISKNYTSIDLEKLTFSNITDEISLGASESIILVKNKPSKHNFSETVSKDITSNFKVKGLTDNYLVMDYISVSKNGSDFGDVLPLQRIAEDLLRENYKGQIWVKQTFIVDVLPKKISFIMEKAKLKSVTINGTPIELKKSDYDFNYLECDITDIIRMGENDIIYSLDYYQHDGVSFALFDPLATESLRNCLYYDTEIENTYLKGDFTVNEDLHICGLKQISLNSELKQQGYPFFKGIMTIEGFYEYDGHKNVTLELDGRFMISEIIVDDKKIDMVLDTKANITELLKKGNNKIELLVHSSLRNLYGPFHYKGHKEENSVSPIVFTLRGTWNGGTSKYYDEKYYCVPFGVDKVKIIENIR